MSKVFKVIIFGGRDFKDPDRMDAELDVILQNKDKIEVVTGRAWGADFYGEQWAKKRGHAVKPFEADWEGHGRAAGPIRNEKMAQYVGKEGGAIGFWDGRSRGTRNMIENAKKYGLRLRVIRY